MAKNVLPLQQVPSKGSIPDALLNFDSLPNAANVRQDVVEGLFSCSSATLWRRVKDGGIPKPRKLSKRISSWNVGQLRAVLRGEGNEGRESPHYAAPAPVTAPREPRKTREQPRGDATKKAPAKPKVKPARRVVSKGTQPQQVEG